MDVDRQIALALIAFSALSKAMFLDKNLSISMKRLVFYACI